MIILKAADVRKALPMDQAVAAMKQAYAALSDGRAEVPLRAKLDVSLHEGLCLFMPAYAQAQDDGGESLALKVVSVFPKNAPRGLPIIHAAVLVLEPGTGRPQALLEGGALTAIRTGAATGAATDLLARPDSRVAAIFGAGVQGRTQLEALCTVREIETAWIHDPAPDKAQTFVDEMSGQGGIPTDLRVAADPKTAVGQADIICTATTSKTPVYDAGHIQPGAHINGIGSYTLEMLENPPEIYSRACAFVDSKEAAMAEAGEIVAAINRKLLFPAELTELGDVILNNEPGRTSDRQITFFKSVGIAVQDAAAAQLALENAHQMGLGQRVSW